MCMHVPVPLPVQALTYALSLVLFLLPSAAERTQEMLFEAQKNLPPLPAPPSPEVSGCVLAMSDVFGGPWRALWCIYNWLNGMMSAARLFSDSLFLCCVCVLCFCSMGSASCAGPLTSSSCVSFVNRRLVRCTPSCAMCALEFSVPCAQ